MERVTEETITDKITLNDLDPRTAQILRSEGVNDLFLVQQATFKPFTEGREIVVKSRTGTGKTLSFLLPLTQLIDKREGGIQALIMEPTRELANQVL